MSAQMSIMWGKPHEPTPSLSIAIHGSDSGIFRMLPGNSLIICQYNSIDRKKIPSTVLLKVCAAGQLSGSVLIISDELRVLVPAGFP